jgi:cell division protein FtsI (penicillin-binding protein 3)
MTTFVGVFPIEAPQYIIMVTIDEPQRTEASSMQRTAAWNAAPTAGRILNAILPLLFE